MPTPLDELKDMTNDGIKYDAALLAPIANAEKHSSPDAIAINCGIYIVNMTYQAIYHKTKDIIKYSSTANQLAAKVDAAQIFEAIVTKNIQSKIKNKDSLYVAIEKGLEAMEMYLVDNKKLAVATQVLVGSWVEMQYILSQSMLSSDSPKDLKQHIFSQREHLSNLLILLQEFKDEAGLHEELEKLKQLEVSFQKIHEAQEVTNYILVEVANEIKTIRNDLLAM